MQPASASGATGGSNRQMKRWGPIIGVLAVVAIGGGVLLATGGDDDDSADDANTTVSAVQPTQLIDTVAPETTAAATDTTAAGGGEITFPLSFPQAVEAGIEGDIDWGDRCDTSTGRLAVPDFFAPECMAPFTGDNGGATSTGVTADEITIVNYIGQENDPIIAYITDAINNDDTNQQYADTMRGLVDYYSAFYELYGRTVNLVTFDGTGGASDEVAARADAATIAEQFSPFVVLGGPALTSAFADELSAREVMCIGCTPGQPPEFFTERDPFVWGLDGSARR